MYDVLTKLVHDCGETVHFCPRLSSRPLASQWEMEHDSSLTVGYNQQVVSEYVGAFITAVCYRLNERRRTFGDWIEEDSLAIHAHSLGGIDKVIVARILWAHTVKPTLTNDFLLYSRIASGSKA